LLPAAERDCHYHYQYLVQFQLVPPETLKTRLSLFERGVRLILLVFLRRCSKTKEEEAGQQLRVPLDLGSGGISVILLLENNQRWAIQSRSRWIANFRLLSWYQQDRGNASGLGHGFWAPFLWPSIQQQLASRGAPPLQLAHVGKYRQEFPDVGHYDGQKIDTVNSLYMNLFACLKYPKWIPSSEVLMLGPPLLGIVSLQDQPLNVHPNPSCQVEPAPIKMTRSFVYLANEQR
jgi:hypothetical protein